MTFPTIPTGTQVLVATQPNATTTRTFPSFSGLSYSAGDLLIAICIGYQSNVTDAAFGTWSNGFTEFHDSATPTTMAIGCAYKITSGSETGSLTVVQASPTGTNSHAALILMAIPGAHASAAPEAGGRASNINSVATPDSITPSWGALDTLWIAVVGSGETGTGGAFTGIAGTPPTDYSGMQETGISGDVVGGVEGGCAFRQLNATSEDPGDFANDTSNARWAAITIAVRPLASIVNGTATGDLVFDGPAFGTVIAPITGTATADLVFSSTTNGVPVKIGTADLVLAFDGPANGTVVEGAVTGTATGNFVFDASATGTKVFEGTATGFFDLVATAIGVPVKIGTATGDLIFDAPGTGTIVGTVTGTGTLDLAFTGSANGVPVVVGTGSGDLAFGAIANGVPIKPGTATGIFTFDGSATGTILGAVYGTATGDLVFAASAVGTPVKFGTATGLLIFDGSATGIGLGPVYGTATGVIIFAAAAAGSAYAGTTAPVPQAMIGTAPTADFVILTGTG